MAFSDILLTWYDQNRRELPWRGERDPYRIWLSEIMLQQTQTATVKPYYLRFLEHFPDVQSLAEAPEEAVLKLWEGLGYYSRARNLHAAAHIITSEMNGRFPSDARGLQKLPGIGPYAANAIASIAYDEPVPALDGNQARVLSRLLAWEDIVKTPFDLLKPAQALLSRVRPGDYNQALMDLGAEICLPKKPKCDVCPVSDFCVALRDDAALDYPKKPSPTVRREEDWTIVVAHRGHQTLVHRRPGGLLGGLYEYIALKGHYPDVQALSDALRQRGFCDISNIERLPDSKHMFTHLIWHMQGYSLNCESAPEGFIWANPQERQKLPFPGALKTYAKS